MNCGSDNHPLLGLEVRRRTGLDDVVEVFIDLLTNGLPDVTVGLPQVFFRSGRRGLHSLSSDQLRDPKVPFQLRLVEEQGSSDTVKSFGLPVGW
jgi:hypothetical protein